MLNHPGRLIWLAIGLMILGVAIPFLIVIKVIESTMLLSFAAFLFQTSGFILGFLGLGLYRGRQKNKRDNDDDWDKK